MEKRTAIILFSIFMLIAIWIWGKNIILATVRKSPVSADSSVTQVAGPVARVAPRTQYDSWGRDPFYAKGEEAALPAFNLEGIIMDPVSPYVIIDGEIKKEGDEIQGAKIVKIESDRVILKIGKREITVTMF